MKILLLDTGKVLEKMSEEKCFNCGKRHDNGPFLGFCSKDCLDAWSKKYWLEKEKGNRYSSKKSGR